MNVAHRGVDDASDDARGGAAGEGAIQRRDATQDGSGAAADGGAAASDGSATASTDGGSAGEAPSSDAIPPSGVGQEHTQCDLNTSCMSNATTTIVTCGVEAIGFACEFEGFVGATADVGSGQHVVIGTACCGGCGCTPVEVYYDGRNCWQGIPECVLPQFMDQMFDPHHTTIPNPSFSPPSTVPGNFYLGSGGIGGAPTATAGASAGGAPGTDSGGAPAGGAPTGTAGTGGASAGTGGTGGTGGTSAGAGGTSAGVGGVSAGTGGVAGSGGAQASAGVTTWPEGGTTAVP
jgi:hypothetical protein